MPELPAGVAAGLGSASACNERLARAAKVRVANNLVVRAFVSAVTPVDPVGLLPPSSADFGGPGTGSLSGPEESFGAGLGQTVGRFSEGGAKGARTP